MSRKKRIWYPGATYHVMSRGNRRTVLFKDTSDYMRFLECIALSKERYGFKIHSLCLMTNHFHIAVDEKRNRHNRAGGQYISATVCEYSGYADPIIYKRGDAD